MSIIYIQYEIATYTVTIVNDWTNEMKCQYQNAEGISWCIGQVEEADKGGRARTQSSSDDDPVSVSQQYT